MTSAGESDTTFSITGGVGSIRYTMGEISAAGLKLARLAEQLEPLVDRLRSEWEWLCTATQQGAPGYPYGGLNYGAVDAVRAALWSCMRVQGDTAELARQTSNAARNYDEAEAHNAAVVAKTAQLQALGSGYQTWIWGPLAPVKLWVDAWHSWRGAKEQGLRDSTEKLLNNGPAYGAAALGPGIGSFYLLTHLGLVNTANSGVGAAAFVRGTFDWAGLAKPGRLAVQAIPRDQWYAPALPWQPDRAVAEPAEGVPGKVESTIKGLLEGSKAAYGYPPGSIGVDRVDRPDGSRVWIVNLPGTEVWNKVDSENPWDLEGDLEGMTAAQKEMFAQQHIVIQELMKAALHAVGALANEEVVITGHSGGGIHAVAAAADPAFLTKVNVKMLIIAGAPAKNLHVAPSIQVLGLENEHDIVTAADFGPAPDLPNWVSVTSHRPGATEGNDPVAIIREAHDLDNYLNDAKAVENSDDPAIRGIIQRVNELLVPAFHGAPVKVHKFVFQGRDVNTPVPARAVPPARKRPANKEAREWR
ncbi:hypothetical protein [Arthrobacter alpinus]|uniref:hypothetical protein n=1 Tax=Arthrobacter alpinus TaxID=656366 RepID=UPI001647645F|nr:hypothetical protein [Arthrobacter alpinus]